MVRPSDIVNWKKIVLILAAVLVTTTVSGLIWFTAKYVPYLRGVIGQSTAVNENLTSLLSDVTQMDVGLRGFITSGDERFIEPYFLIKKEIDRKLEVLAHLLSEESEQTSLRALRALIERRTELIDESIRLRRSGQPKQAANIATRGETTMVEIREVVIVMRSQQERLLQRAFTAPD
jgi:CHASE3 domain sensor protein